MARAPGPARLRSRPEARAILEQIDLGKKLPKRRYKERVPALQERLYQLQRACYEAGLASVVVFEGWDASGKGAAIKKLTELLEPRAFRIHSIREPRTFETHMPWMWRFWMLLPRYGEMAIFDRSWYFRLLEERVEKVVPKREWQRAFRHINGFERALVEDRHAVVKVLLHLSKKERKARFRALEKDPATSWRVTPQDWKQHKKYDRYLLALEELLERTETEWAPWTIVEATDSRWARVRVFEAVIERLESALVQRGMPLPGSAEAEGRSAATDEDRGD